MALPQHGLLLVDKPAGWTSHDVVGFTRKKLKMKSVGHCGTLDPAATGLLVLLLGEATKLSQYLLEQDKSYSMKIKLGTTTTSGDLDGEIVSEKPVEASKEKILEVANSLQGELSLKVPSFSAIKVDGERLYKKARRGEEVETPERVMRFFDLKILKVEGAEVEAEVHCSKGSYIRSWVTELGERLGCGATLANLRRLESQPYSLSQAIDCAKIEESAAAGSWSSGFIPMSEALTSWKALRIQGHDQKMLRNGQIAHDLKANLIRIFKPGIDQGVRILSSEGDLLALIGVEPGKGFVIRRVFNPQITVDPSHPVQ